jgi:N,N'-diacetyllegionaminate synthase
VLIGNHTVGDGHKAFIIAEIAQAHDGSLGLAHAYIDAVAEAGADAIKFQTHIAEAESSPGEPFRVNFSYEDKTRYDYWKRMEFTQVQWAGLADHAAEKNLVFLSSPFSFEAVTLLQSLSVPAWKVGSGEVFNPLLLQRLKETQLPIIASTGMSTLDDVMRLLVSFSDYEPGFAVMQCTTMYPTPLDYVGMENVQLYRDIGGTVVGLSDHSGQITPSQIAIARGANIIEVHVTFDKGMFGPDTSSSIDMDELSALVQFSKDVICIDQPIKQKNVVSEELSSLKQMFGKALIAEQNIDAGCEVTLAHLGARKPMNGIPVDQFESLLNKKAKRVIVKGERLDWDDFI